jgi:hypothetical protein
MYLIELSDCGNFTLTLIFALTLVFALRIYWLKVEVAELSYSSAVNPEDLITGSHMAISRLINAAKLCGVPCIASIPNLA